MTLTTPIKPPALSKMDWCVKYEKKLDDIRKRPDWCEHEMTFTPTESSGRLGKEKSIKPSCITCNKHNTENKE
jgi:hypothetical protein